jgi:hypothetical protein
MKTRATQITAMALVAFAVCSVHLALSADASSISKSASYGGNFLGRDYVTEVSGSVVGKAPRWAPTEANPPLSVRAAEQAASNALSKVVGDMKKWRREGIALDDWKQGCWTYRFSFVGPSIQTTNISSRLTNATSWRASSLSVVVLMNGEAIAPTPTTMKERK